ncbi:MAG: capsular biosynthesis protein [Bernardetiaceae bacterium]|nr:capsular biosynthesis protein [Bernardetiaceae bacterium]
MISLFKRHIASYGDTTPIKVDMHSHLLPAIDDGCKNYEESIHLIEQFIDAGYEKIITTPHVMGDFYRNTPEIILDKLDKLRDIIKQMGLKIEIDAAAEYYADDYFLSLVEKEEQLLSFGKKRYILFETSYINPFPKIEQLIFLLQASGYTPILAHPERYTYLYDNLDRLYQWREKGVLLQININSLTGYYSKPAQKLAELIIDENMVDFIASDCHNNKHFQNMKKAKKLKYYRRAIKNDKLRNNELLTT